MKQKTLIAALCLTLAAFLAACGGENKQEAPALSIDAAALGAEPSFIDHTQDGVAMQLIAIKDADDTVRLALNTCQSCGGSPYAWFEYIGDDTLQCQNCGLTFHIVDAIDTVSGKIALVLNARAAGTPIISAMGAGNKLEASLFEVADIYETSVCPLSRVMRRELRKRGVERLKVVYSKEKPARPLEDMSISCRDHCICPPGAERKCIDRRDIPGSVAFVPSVVGLILAGEVVKDLTQGCAREVTS